MLARPAVAAASVIVALLGVAACAGADDDPAGAGATLVVTATDDACTLDESTVTAGPVTLDVTNDGDQVTEVYVYAEGEAIVAEKEDITPGLSVEFTATLDAGSYQIACKPGQTGDGYRADLTVE